jgi:hypothetical protein
MAAQPAPVNTRGVVDTGENCGGARTVVVTLCHPGAGLRRGGAAVAVVFTVSGLNLGQSLSSGDVAAELVRTLTGSIGLVAAVPITTGFRRAGRHPRAGDTPKVGRPRPEKAQSSRELTDVQET